MDPLAAFSLKDKTILITGASSGIGRQCAFSCSSAGAKLIIMGRNHARLAETFETLEGKHHQAFMLDLNDEAKSQKVLASLQEKNKSIDGIIHAAGISTTLPFRSTSPDKMNEYFNTNVAAAFNLSRLMIKNKLMNKNGGSIIFLASVMGSVGEMGKTLYGMTKGALLAGSKSMAIELASKNIRVNCISPGVVESPMSKNAIYSRDEASLQKIKDLHPLGLGKPDDVANACIYLLSDASRWITGTNLIVDGGYTAR
ncbi:MAG: SDR family oxidoreductase [Bacteroidales bacterium]|nr:SDR family oxidoreductase [Bacteroidales bacterium]